MDGGEPGERDGADDRVVVTVGRERTAFGAQAAAAFLGGARRTRASGRVRQVALGVELVTGAPKRSHIVRAKEGVLNLQARESRAVAQATRELRDSARRVDQEPVRPPRVLRGLRLRKFVSPDSQCMTETAQHSTELLARAGATVDRQPTQRAEYGRPLEFGEGTIDALVEGDSGAQVRDARRGPTHLPAGEQAERQRHDRHCGDSQHDDSAAVGHQHEA
jgi:hypothetical protein